MYGLSLKYPTPSWGSCWVFQSPQGPQGPQGPALELKQFQEEEPAKLADLQRVFLEINFVATKIAIK